MLTDATQDETCQLTVFGFYSVVELDSIGYCGGFLVLNESGRPLEFHCTLPVLPERSQEILYGESLRPFLLGEHIGPPLICRAKSRVSLVLVNQRDALNLGQHINCPVVCIDPDEEPDSSLISGNFRILDALKDWQNQAGSFNLKEPFERIEFAIEEAHSVTRQEA